MIEAAIDWCSRNRFLVVLFAMATVLAGVWSLRRTPLDALPDISDVQVIIHTPWTGEPPEVIEDQVTYPIVTTMLAAPRVKAVRAQTMFNDSYVYVVFQDGTDLYWARSRVLEYMQQLQSLLPAGVHPAIGPDATGAGWIYEYVVLDRRHNLSLADLDTLQRWYIRYQLETVPGVAEVASIGGFVRQYQVKLDPNRLLALHVSLQTVIDKIRDSNNEVGGRVLEMSGADYMVRGLGYIKTLAELGNVPVGSHDGTPILVRDLGVVSFGPDLREGIAEWNGEGQTVGGIVVMRYGQNALSVINGIKAKLAQIQSSLPAGVQIVAGYDRSGLIDASIATLTRDLIDEAIIVSLVVIVFLFHFRSALIPILSIPVAVLASFIPMFYLQVSSNIMSLGGFALAIGVLIDAAIVMVENAYRHLAEQTREGRRLTPQAHKQVVIGAAKQVGRPLFYSLIIIVVSFLPVFLLEAQEGRMFKPLAYTKTFAIAFSSLLAITIVPLLMVWLVRARRYRREQENPVARFFQMLYLPVIRVCLRHRIITLGVGLLFLAATFPLAGRIGTQFMPPLFEGSMLYMPTALPGISITTAGHLLQEQDRILKSFPEVESVFGTVGRSDSATDNAPMDMYDTTVTLRPRAQWPAGMDYDRLVQEMNAKLDFPGLANTWTMPVENRLDMELTGIKTPVGLKVQGPQLGEIERIGGEVERILSGVADTRGVFAERVAEGFYVNIEVDRAQAARYGLTVGDVQRLVSSGMGGENIALTVQGRDRFPINVRYLRDYRQNLSALRQMLIMTPQGAQIPLSEVARVTLGQGPSMIRDEGAQLTAYVFVDLATNDYSGYVARAQRALDAKLHLPAGYSIKWSGEYSFELRAKQRLRVIVPIVIMVIFVLLYVLFDALSEALILLFPCAFALTGGLLLQYMLGINFSVAVAVGYIDLFGIAVETGVIMIILLDEALDLRLARGPVDHLDIEAATIEGAVHRLRPKLMTVFVVIFSLVPIFFQSGIGNDVMKPIAVPIVGGMITSSIAVLILVPVLFAMVKERALGRGLLRPPAAGAPQGSAAPYA
ncbi:MAG TPA: CusA/CzcA family heavy metal efflux RND transporter [Candidatus Binataceae bacterium]|nr:CusA/CzcA family heavy metal efflux RND transporter [Candidatus Binataceae bacterium]